MDIISRAFERNPPLPWTEDSIFNAICRYLDPASGSLRDGLRLPDEAALELKGGPRYTAGARDGIATHHMGFHANQERAVRAASLLDRAARRADPAALVECYRLLQDDDVLEIIDALLAQLIEMRTPVEPLKALALELATRSRDRGPVKVGIALLGATEAVEHRQIVTTLGKHDELTLYAAVALCGMLPEPLLPMWELARHVKGWGRIQVIERLVPTDNVELQRWLRTEGYCNSVMNEYLALIAATHGRLLAALEQPSLPPDELAAACDLICALIASDAGPVAGMDSYADAADVCLQLLRHIAVAPADLRHLLAVQAMLGYLAAEQREQAERLKHGWSEGASRSVQSLASELAARPLWAELVRTHLDAPDDASFHRADQCARQMGLDTFQWHWRRLESGAQEPGNWFRVMRAANPERIDQIVAFAGRTLPLEAIATGPDSELGLGKAFQAHTCLGFVLQDLPAFPGKGRALILAGLRSPVVSNRNKAIGALEAWEPTQRADLQDALARAYEEEVNETVRARLVKLLT